MKAKYSHPFDYLSFEKCRNKTMGFGLRRKASFKFVSKAVNSLGAGSGLELILNVLSKGQMTQSITDM